MLPFLIVNGYWLGVFGEGIGIGIYLLPTILCTLAATIVATAETRHTYPERFTPSTLARRIARIVPYVVINTGMLPHQVSAFCEGMFGPLNSEFERTPKTASITTQAGAGPRSAPVATRDPDLTKRYDVKVHWPYVLTEAFFVAYQLTWAVVFAIHGLLLSALGAAFVAGCVLALAYFYGDHAGKVCFVVDRATPGFAGSRRAGAVTLAMPSQR